MEELLAAVMTALTDAGLDAVPALPAGAFAGLAAPRVAVGLESAQRDKPAYLGGGQSQTEVFGQNVQAVFFADVFSPTALGGAACSQTAGQVCAALLEGVPGLTVSRVTLGRCGFDQTANCFTCTVRLEAAGYLYAAREPDAPELTGFTLRGNLL